MPGDEFTFTMTSLDGAPLPKKSLAVLTPSPDGSGSLFCFGGKDDPIVFTEPGSYEYLIYELSSDMPGVANIEGVNYDAAVYRLTVNVKDNGDGTMSVESSKFEVSSDGSGEEWTSADASNADFTNTYFFDVDSVVIDALKALTGRQLNEGEFTFVLEAEEGVPMPEGSEKTADGLVGFEAHNLSDGGVLFDGIVFTPEKLKKRYGRRHLACRAVFCLIILSLCAKITRRNFTVSVKTESEAKCQNLRGFC